MPRRACFLLLLLAAPAFAQQTDRVYYIDRTANNKEDTADGVATETPAGVKMVVGGKERVIPAQDLLRIDYAGLEPATDRVKVSQTEGKPAAEALKYYADTLAALPANAPEKTRRFLAFREAHWSGVVAAGKEAGEFPAAAKQAVEKMRAFVKAYPKTWEQWQVGRTAARLSGELGDWKAADDILRGLSGVPDAPAELKQDAKLARVGYLIRAGEYADAGAALAEAEGATAGQKERAAIYAEALKVLPAKDGTEADPADPSRKKKVDPAAAVGKIEKLIAASKDAGVRAVGYGVIGEVQLAHRQTRQATWSFCTVDTVYPQDQDERVFALVRLVELFTLSGDKDGEKNRAEQFRERLRTAR
jgi:hypothetical protein